MNSLLLDSHIFLWAITAAPQLSKGAARLIETTPYVYVSALSIFELKMKKARGKLKLPDNLDQLIKDQKFHVLELTFQQLASYRIFSEKNTDPFDNALLTIAETQHFRFLTKDSDITSLQNQYGWIIDGRA